MIFTEDGKSYPQKKWSLPRFASPEAQIEALVSDGFITQQDFKTARGSERVEVLCAAIDRHDAAYVQNPNLNSAYEKLRQASFTPRRRVGILHREGFLCNGDRLKKNGDARTDEEMVELGLSRLAEKCGRPLMPRQPAPLPTRQAAQSPSAPAKPAAAPSPGTVLDQFAKLEGVEATKFYNQHSVDIKQLAAKRNLGG